MIKEEGRIMGSVNLEAQSAKRRSDVVEWLNNLFPNFNLPLEASDEELRVRLCDGFVFFSILGMMIPSHAEEIQAREYAPEKWLEYVRRFLRVADEIGLPRFEVLDLEQGSMYSVVVCLLSLRDHLNSSNANGSFQKTLVKRQCQPGERTLGGNNLKVMEVQQEEHANGEQISTGLGDERKPIVPQLKFQCSVRGSIMSEPSTPLPYHTGHKLEPSTPLPYHTGHKFHEFFQLKQGQYSDLPAAKISEMMKSNSLDSAPTQSLLRVVKGILDESIERKSGEIPQSVACLLQKVVQEVERRISTQAQHIRNQNSLFKAREEKYQSRIRMLETLASGTNEETKIMKDQIQYIKIETHKIEESKILVEQDVVRLTSEKEVKDHKISKLQQDLDTTKQSYKNQCQQLEAKANLTKGELEERIKGLEFLLADSRKKLRELEEFSEAKFQVWKHKQYILQSITGSQLQTIQGLKASSESIKNDVINTKQRWSEDLCSLGKKLKVLTNAVGDFHTVIAENRKLFNDIQELKGNIRVHCRIRPFLSGENRKSKTIDYIGEDGELLLSNPFKRGKDGQRTFKFNKVFGSAATQEEVFLDIQPLIRSVLDGYNVCIFAYGQTGSGKTYTMTGPNSPSKEDWGVNYRALNDLFHISRNRRNTITYEVGVQMVEIYNEQVRDLLATDTSQKKLGVLNTSQPNGLVVPDASMHTVNSTSDVLELMQIGLANRAIGATALNERSSRSHSIVTVHVRGVDLKVGSTLRGSLHLVDLAGSERVNRSEVAGDRLREAQHINKSLSALGDVIFALSQKSSHVPYRNSKLTQVLQGSLGGQAKTLMFVQINPDVQSYSETFSTLRFAERVSGVELGAARSKKESKDIRALMEQVASLKETITRKNEEIDRLQLLKDIGNQSPHVSERHGSNSLRHSSSSHGLYTLGAGGSRGRRMCGRKGAVYSKKAASDPGNSSDYSDKHSDASSHQSMDDFGHQKEILGHPNLPRVDASQISNADIDLLGFGDGDSDGRLSDVSDSYLSVGAETDVSMISAIEFSSFPDHCKPLELRKDKMLMPTQIPRPASSQRVVQTTVTGTSTKETSRSSSSRRSVTNQTASSSVKSTKRWL